VIGLTVESRSDVTRGPLQESHAETCFELLYSIRHRRARQAKVLGRERKAAPFHHPGEYPHRVKPVHFYCS
jgi:hypothetical protein